MIIGITGGIASGKSTTTKYLIDKGYHVVDADLLSYQALTTDDECISQCLHIFDCRASDGSIDRKKLGAIIFNDKKAQKQLENIVHPYVIKKIEETISLNDKPFLFLDIPLLYEAKLTHLCDKVVVVYAQKSQQLERLMKRNRFTRDEAIMRIQAQMDIEQKKILCDYVIDNQLDYQTLQTNIEVFVKELEGGTIKWKNC